MTSTKNKPLGGGLPSYPEQGFKATYIFPFYLHWFTLNIHPSISSRSSSCQILESSAALEAKCLTILCR